MARSDTIVEIGVMLKKADAANVNNELRQMGKNVASFNNNPIVSKNYTQPLGRITGAANEFTKSLEASNARVLAFGASAGAMFAVQKAMQELVKTTITLERQFKEIELLFEGTAKSFKGFQDNLFAISRQTGSVFADVAESATEFARQGLQAEETANRVAAAMTLSQLSGMKAADATEALTAAVNTFNSKALDATTIVNKLAQADAKFAVNSADLAEGIKRSASSALDAKVSFEELGALITSLQQRTARGGAVIGNSLKSIFTRIQGPAVLDQLELLGVRVRETNGETLGALTILKNYAKAYGSLSPAVKATTAQMVAGKFQINALQSVLADLNSTSSVTDDALKVLQGTTDEASSRISKLTATTQGQLNATLTDLKRFAYEAGTQTLGPAIENILNVINTTIGAFRIDDAESIGGKIGTGIYEGIGKVLSGPGLVLLGVVLGKIAVNLGKFLADSGAQFLNLNKSIEEQGRLQNIIQQTLIRRPEILSQIASGTKTIKQLEVDLKGHLAQSNSEYQMAVELSKQLALNMRDVNLSSGGVQLSAQGFIPNFGMASSGRRERRAAANAGYAAGDIKQANIKGVGKVTYNNNESLVRFPGFQQPAIMPPHFSEAGKNYQKAFMGIHGFNPYAASGFVPNFVKPTLRSIGANHIQAAYNLEGYFTKEEKAQLDKDGLFELDEQDKQIFKTGKYAKKNTGNLSEIEKSIQQKLTSEKMFDIREGVEKAESIAAGRKNIIIDAQQKVGLLSLFPTTKGKSVDQTDRKILGKTENSGIPALKAQAQALINAGELADDPKITMTNIAIRDASSAFRFQKGQTTKKNTFTDAITKHLSVGVGDLVGEFFTGELSAYKLESAEIKDRIKKLTDSGRLLNAAAEAALFEQTVKIAATPGKVLEKMSGSSDKSAFDFLVDENFRKVFDYGKQTVVSDAKRNASEDMPAAIVKTINHIAAGKRGLESIDNQLTLFDPRKGLGAIEQASKEEQPRKFLGGGDSKSGLRLEERENRSGTAASGFIPNFKFTNQLQEAINREKRSGIKSRDVRVGFDKRLKSSGGVGVYNKYEGSLGNAIDMHMSLGKNSQQIQRQGRLAATGIVPNFAAGDKTREILGQKRPTKKTGQAFSSEELLSFQNAVNGSKAALKSGILTQEAYNKKIKQLIATHGFGKTASEKLYAAHSVAAKSVEKNSKETQENTQAKRRETKATKDSTSGILGLSAVYYALTPIFTSAGSSLISLESDTGRLAKATLNTAGELVAFGATLLLVQQSLRDTFIAEKLAGIAGGKARGGFKRGVGPLALYRTGAKGSRATMGPDGVQFSRRGTSAGGVRGGVSNVLRGALPGGAGSLAATGAVVGGVAALGFAADKFASELEALEDSLAASKAQAASEKYTKLSQATDKVGEAVDNLAEASRLAATSEDTLYDARVRNARENLRIALAELGSSKKAENLRDKARNLLEGKDEKLNTEEISKLLSDLKLESSQRSDSEKALQEFNSGLSEQIRTGKDLTATQLNAFNELILRLPSKESGKTVQNLLNLNSKALNEFVGSMKKVLFGSENAVIPEDGQSELLRGGVGIDKGVRDEAFKELARLLRKFGEEGGQTEKVIAELEDTLINRRDGAFDASREAVRAFFTFSELENLAVPFEAFVKRIGDLTAVDAPSDEAQAKADKLAKQRQEETERLRGVLRARAEELSLIRSSVKIRDIENKSLLKQDQIRNKTLLSLTASITGKISQTLLEFDKGIKEIDLEESIKKSERERQGDLEKDTILDTFLQKQFKLLDEGKVSVLGSQLPNTETGRKSFQQNVDELTAAFSGANVLNLEDIIKNTLIDADTPRELKNELTALADQARELRLKQQEENNVSEATIKAKKAELDLAKRGAILQELQKRRLAFGGGGELGALSPQETLKRFRTARGDVLFGRQTGDSDRETAGLVEQAKILKNLRIGFANPAETLLKPVTDRFAANISEVLKGTLGVDSLTSEQQKAVARAAEEQAKALIEPEAVQKANTEAVKELTGATTALANVIISQGGAVAVPSAQFQQPNQTSSQRQGGKPVKGAPVGRGGGSAKPTAPDFFQQRVDNRFAQGKGGTARINPTATAAGVVIPTSGASAVAGQPMRGAPAGLLPDGTGVERLRSNDPNKGGFNFFDEFKEVGKIVAKMYGDAVENAEPGLNTANRAGVDFAGRLGAFINQKAAAAAAAREAARQAALEQQRNNRTSGPQDRSGSATGTIPSSAGASAAGAGTNFGPSGGGTITGRGVPSIAGTPQSTASRAGMVQSGNIAAVQYNDPNQSLLNRIHGLNRQRFRDKTTGFGGLINLLNPRSSGNLLESTLGSTGVYGSMFGTDNAPGLYADNDAQDRLQDIIDELKNIRAEEKKQNVQRRNINLTPESMGLSRLFEYGVGSGDSKLSKQFQELKELLKGEGPSITPSRGKIIKPQKPTPRSYELFDALGDGQTSIQLPPQLLVALSDMGKLAKEGTTPGSIYTEDEHVVKKLEELEKAMLIVGNQFSPDALRTPEISRIMQKQFLSKRQSGAPQLTSEEREKLAAYDKAVAAMLKAQKISIDRLQKEFDNWLKNYLKTTPRYKDRAFTRRHPSEKNPPKQKSFREFMSERGISDEEVKEIKSFLRKNRKEKPETPEEKRTREAIEQSQIPPFVRKPSVAGHSQGQGSNLNPDFGPSLEEGELIKRELDNTKKAREERLKQQQRDAEEQARQLKYEEDLSARMAADMNNFNEQQKQQRKAALEKERKEQEAAKANALKQGLKNLIPESLLSSAISLGQFINSVMNGAETIAGSQIKGKAGNQIEDITKGFTEIFDNINIQGKSSEAEIEFKALAAALESARENGLSTTEVEKLKEKIQKQITKNTKDLTNEETRLDAARVIAAKGIRAIAVAEAERGLDSAKLLFEENLIDNVQKRAAAEAVLNAKLEAGKATLKDITNVIGSDMSYNFNSFQKDVARGTIELFDTFKSGTKEALGEAIRGTSTLKEAFSKVFQSIADKALDKSISMAVDATFAGIKNNFFAKGGFVKGYNSGGMVSGGSGYKDDVPAMLTRGEYVMRKSAVNKYGEGFFQKLNTGGMAKEIRTARSADIRLLNEYLYNDPKRPTSGKFNEDQRLSAFARRNQDDRRNVLKFERERALKDYIKARDEHYKQQDEIQANFRDQLRGRRRGALIGAGLSIGVGGIFSKMEGGRFFGQTRDYRNPFGGTKAEVPLTRISAPRTFNPVPNMSSPGGAGRNQGAHFQRPTFVPEVRPNRDYLATGGFTSRDNVPAMLMGGEYVVNKDTVNRYGKNFFDQLNSGRVRGYAEGGIVGGSGGIGSTTVGDTNISITVNVEGNGNAVTTDVSENEERRSGGDQGKQLANTIKVAVLNELTEQKRPGGILYKN